MHFQTLVKNFFLFIAVRFQLAREKHGTGKNIKKGHDHWRRGSTKPWLDAFKYRSPDAAAEGLTYPTQQARRALASARLLYFPSAGTPRATPMLDLPNSAGDL